MKWKRYNRMRELVEEGEIVPPEKKFEDARIKVVLGLASEICFASYWLSLFQLNTPKDIVFNAAMGSYDANLTYLCKDYENYDAILLTDWDHSFKKESLKNLWDRNLPVVSGLFKSRKNKKYLIATEHPYTYLNPPSMEEIFNVDSTGMGFMLIRREVFERLPEPIFGSVDGGVDRHFCNKLRLAGFDVWIDPTVEVKHLIMEFI